MMKLVVIQALFLSIFILKALGQVSECRYDPENAQIEGQDCTSNRQCNNANENCLSNNNRQCVCDGYCGLRCIKVRRDSYCAVLEIPANALPAYDSSRQTAFNTTVSYTCTQGSLLLSGDLTRKCRGDGSWSGVEPRCVDPAEYCSRKATAIASTRRECLTSCTIQGNECGNNETCICDDLCGMSCIQTEVENYCDFLPAVDHATTTYDPLTRIFGSKATLECESGYRVSSGDKERTCGGDGKWSGEDLVCQTFVTCPKDDIPVVDNAQPADVQDYYEPGDSLFYDCNYGHYRTGRRHIWCNHFGLWDPLDMVCRLKTCPSPNVPENGGRIGNNFSFGSTVELTCNVGYEMRGWPYKTCQGDQTWSGYDVECRPIECPKLYPPADGSIQPEDVYIYQTRVEMTCNEGFIPENGSTMRECQANGEWSGELFSCRAINCGDPGTPQNGEKINNNYGLDDVVYFRCNNGFELKGNTFIRCTSSEEWSADRPECRGFCILPNPPANSHYRNNQVGRRLEDGDTATLRCDSGHTLTPNEPWTCDNGQAAKEIQCIENPCHTFDNTASTSFTYNPAIADGSVSVAARTVALITCRTGFRRRQGARASVRCELGTWTDTVSDPCEAEPCTALLTPHRGTVIYDRSIDSAQKYPHNTEASYTCVEGYTFLEAYHTPVCHYGHWTNSKTIQCVPAPCDTFQLPNGLVSYSQPADSNGKHPHAATATFSQCHTGYDLRQGDGWNACDFGVWKGRNLSPASTCQPVACAHERYSYSKVKYYLNGVLQDTEEPFHLVSRQFSCPGGFKMIGNGESQCRLGNWTHSAPYCEGLGCTPHAASNLYTLYYHPQQPSADGKYRHTTRLQFVCVEGRLPNIPGAMTHCYAGQWQNTISCESQNIAEGKYAIQSSEVQENMPASNAVDGNPSMVFADNSCTHTRHESNSWWRVDLQKIYTIHTVTLVNTNDSCCRHRLKGATIWVGKGWSNPPDFTTHQQCGAAVTKREAKNYDSITRDCGTGTMGRYVSVQLDDERLHLCEVLVFGDAVNGCFVPSILDARVERRTFRGNGPEYTAHPLTPNEFVNSQTYIYVVCDEGYTLQNRYEHVQFCKDDGTYDHNRPACIPSPCYVRDLYYGRVERVGGSYYIQHGDTVSYRCYDNYEKLYDEPIRCDFGKLLPEKGHTCISASCRIPSLQSNVQTDKEYPGGKLPEGQYVTFSCTIGFQLSVTTASNTYQAYCNRGNLQPAASVIEALECRPIPCNSPSNPDHGNFHLVTGQGHHQGDIIQLECDDGYVVDGNPLANCDEGRWSELATCKLDIPDHGNECRFPHVECGRIWKDGREIFSHTHPWLEHTAEILVAYSILDSRGSLCNNGAWTPPIESCQATCQRPPLSTASKPLTVIQTINGETRLTESSPQQFPLGTVIEARCQDIGKARLIPSISVRRVCTGRGWSSAYPICESVGTKLLFKDAKNIRQVHPNGTIVIQENYGQLKIQCDIFYIPTKYAIINGPNRNAYGRRDYNYLYDIHTYNLGTPKSWYSGRYTCTNNDGTEEHAIDIQVRDARCHDPGAPENGFRTVNANSFHMRGKVTFSCQPGFDLHGNTQIVCIIGKWSGPIPECAAPACPQLTVPPDVTTMGGNTNTYKSERLFFCPHGFETVNGENKIQSICQRDGSWSRQPPVCSVNSNQPDEIGTTVSPCLADSCEEWEICVGVNGKPTCYCDHPSKCELVAKSVVCGTDGKNYTNLCQLRSMACFFGRDVDLEKKTPCSPEAGNQADEYSFSSDDAEDNENEDEYSLSSFTNLETATNVHIPSTRRPPAEGSVGMLELPANIEPEQDSDRAGCPADCGMVSLDEACHNANTAFQGRITPVNVSIGQHEVEVLATYFGNLTSPILINFSHSRTTSGCFCPTLHENTREYVILSQSRLEGNSLSLQDLDYVETAIIDGVNAVIDNQECWRKMNEHRQQN